MISVGVATGRQRWTLVAVGFALAILACSASAQLAYPAARPIKLVVPYPAGALTDLLARAIGERLGAELQQSVVVERWRK